MMGFPGIFEVLLLIALGFGYIVLYLAKREEKGLQFLGYTLGVIIIVLSLIYLAGNILTQATCYPKVRSPAMPHAPAQKP